VANLDDKTPDFDELDLPGDDPGKTEPSDESAPSDDNDVASQADEAEEAELQADVTDKAEPEAEEEAKTESEAGDEEKDEAKVESEEEEEEKAESEEEEPEEESKKDGLLKVISNSNPYTVMLGLALVAVLIAVLCLLFELRLYDFDIKARNLPVMMVPMCPPWLVY
jgi:hypothetical protein